MSQSNEAVHISRWFQRPDSSPSAPGKDAEGHQRISDLQEESSIFAHLAEVLDDRAAPRPASTINFKARMAGKAKAGGQLGGRMIAQGPALAPLPRKPIIPGGGGSAPSTTVMLPWPRTGLRGWTPEAASDAHKMRHLAVTARPPRGDVDTEGDRKALFPDAPSSRSAPSPAVAPGSGRSKKGRLASWIDWPVLRSYGPWGLVVAVVAIATVSTSMVTPSSEAPAEAASSEDSVTPAETAATEDSASEPPAIDSPVIEPAPEVVAPAVELEPPHLVAAPTATATPRRPPAPRAALKPAPVVTATAVEIPQPPPPPQPPKEPAKASPSTTGPIVF